MQLNIKNDEAHRMASEIARLTGESMTQAVVTALEQRLEDVRQRSIEGRAALEERIEALVEEMKALPVLDDRTPEEMLYDDDGLPR